MPKVNVRNPFRRLVRAVRSKYDLILSVEERRSAVASATEAALRPRQANQVVFISDVPRSREAKLAFGLRNAGWRVVLLHRDIPTFDATEHFDEVHSYRDAWAALRAASHYSPMAFHVFSNWNFEVAYTIIKHRPGKIVFDDYDVFAGMVNHSYQEREYGQHYLRKLSMEQFCLENADAICCRSIETQYAKRFLGYRYGGRRLFFPDYCWDIPEALLPHPRSRSIDKHPHVVFVGNMAVEKELPEGDGDAFHLWLARKFSDMGVHYHLYPTYYDKDFDCLFSDYIALSKQTPFFHLHKPVAPDQLVSEISVYDFGILVLSRDIDGIETHGYYTTKYDYAMSNKIFDYFDAGLPIIMHRGRFQHFIASRYEACINASSDLLGSRTEFLRRVANPCLFDNALKARSAYSIRNHVCRLERLYGSLSSSA